MKRDVRIEIEGGMLERLLDRALADGARFAELRRISPRKISLSADESSAGIVLSLCERYRLNCAVVSRSGASALLGKLRTRWTLALGCALCLMLAMGFLARLWRVEISFTGPAAALGKRAEILDSLEESGLRTGMPLSEIDADLLQKQLMADCSGLSFVGVRLQGIRLLVEAAPEVPSPALYDRDYARDLVAERDGVVLSINVRSGEACVEAGDTVRRGQTLIRGEEEKTKEETVPVAALGEVIARCWFEGSAEGSLVEEASIPTGKTCEECRLKLMDFSLPITRCEAFASEDIRVEILPVVGLFLPLEIERTVHIETRTQARSIDPQALEEKLAVLARAEALSQIGRAGVDPQQLTFWEDRTVEGSRLRVRAVAEVSADIAAARSELN